MGGFKNLGWAEQGLKFLEPAYASPGGQPHLPIFAREDADDGEREDEDEADDEDENEDGREQHSGPPAEGVIPKESLLKDSSRIAPSPLPPPHPAQGEGRPASNRPRSLDHLTVQGKRRFLFRRVKILKSGFRRISRLS